MSNIIHSSQLTSNDVEAINALHNYNPEKFKLQDQYSTSQLRLFRYFIEHFLKVGTIGEPPGTPPSPLLKTSISIPAKAFTPAAPNTIKRFEKLVRSNPTLFDQSYLNAPFSTSPISTTPPKMSKPTGTAPSKMEIEEGPATEEKKKYTKKSLSRKIRITPAMFMAAKRSKKFAKQLGLIPRARSAWQMTLKSVAARPEFRNTQTGKVDPGRWPDILKTAQMEYEQIVPKGQRGKRKRRTSRLLNRWQAAVQAALNEYKTSKGLQKIGKNDFKTVVEVLKHYWIKGQGKVSDANAVRLKLGISSVGQKKGSGFGYTTGGTGRFGSTEETPRQTLDDFSGSGMHYGSALFY